MTLNEEVSPLISQYFYLGAHQKIYISILLIKKKEITSSFPPYQRHYYILFFLGYVTPFSSFACEMYISKSEFLSRQEDCVFKVFLSIMEIMSL